VVCERDGSTSRVNDEAGKDAVDIHYAGGHNPSDTANLSPAVAPLTALQRCRADSPEAKALFDVINEETLTVIGDHQNMEGSSRVAHLLSARVPIT